MEKIKRVKKKTHKGKNLDQINHTNHMCFFGSKLQFSVWLGLLNPQKNEKKNKEKKKKKMEKGEKW